MTKMVLVCAMLAAGCTAPAPGTRAEEEEGPLEETWGDCRYEMVVIPVTSSPNVLSDEEARAVLLTGKATHGYPRTILLNQCSGETWLLRRYKWEPMVVDP